MRLRSRVLFVFLMVAALLVVAPTAAAADDNTAAQPAVFRVGMAGDFNGVNMFGFPGVADMEIWYQMYDFLTYHDEDLQPIPWLAESWSSSEDGLVWTFKIRSGVKWHDGQPLTARDVAFTFNLIMNNPDYTFNWLTYVTDLASVEAPDDSTVVMTCSQPKADILTLWLPILPEHLWGSIDPSTLPTLENPPAVGSGPFVFDSAGTGQVIMKANKDYWGGAPAIDGLQFLLYTSMDSLVADYQAGNLDYAVFEAPSALRAVEGVEGSKAASFVANMTVCLVVNCLDSPDSGGNPLLVDPKVRQAIHWAIDNQKLVEQCTDGKGAVAQGLAPSEYGDWYTDIPADKLATYDPAKAKQILEDAGYTDTDGDGIREDAQGNKLSFRMAAMAEYPAWSTAATIISQWLTDVGIEATLESVAYAAFYDRVYGPYDFDMFVDVMPMDIDPNFAFSWLTSFAIGMFSNTGFSNPDYDALYDQQSHTVDHATRVGLVHDMIILEYEQAPYIPLWYAPASVAYRTDRWAGFRETPIDLLVDPTYGLDRAQVQLLTPSGGTAGAAAGLSGGAIAGIVVAAVVVVGGLLTWLLLRRRKPPVEEA